MTAVTSRTVGVIGAGSISFGAHLPLLRTMGIDVPWIVDASNGRARAAGAAYDIPQCLDADQLDRAAPVDVVLIACPYGARKPYFEFFADKPGALYVEKPVARSMAELDGICALRAPYQIAAGFLRRSMGTTRIMRAVIADRLFGRLTRIRSEFGTSTSISAGASYAKDVALAGGGQLIESAIHNIDAICYMAGITAAHVERAHMIHENRFDLHTDATLTLVDGSGEPIDMELLVTCFRTTNYEIRMEFERADVTFSLFTQMAPQVRARSPQATTFQLLDAVASDYPRQVFDMAHLFWSDFLDGLDRKSANYTNANTTAATTSIIEQLYAHAS